MYKRKRIARGVGATLAVWGLIGLIAASTGVAYAAPIAGIGGFNIAANEITADQLLLYPGVGDTTNQQAYPQSVAELQNADLRDLTLYKTISLQRVPGLTGNARLQLNNYGRVDGGDVLVKSSALTSEQTTFREFTLDEANTGDPSTAFSINAEDGATLTGAGIQAHYLAAESISLDNLYLQFCYDPDSDGQWEHGNCIVGDPVGDGIDSPGGIGTIDTGLPPDTPDSEESSDDDNFTPGDIGQPVQDAIGTVTDAVGDAVDAVGDAVDAVGDAIGSLF